MKLTTTLFILLNLRFTTARLRTHDENRTKQTRRKVVASDDPLDIGLRFSKIAFPDGQDSGAVSFPLISSDYPIYPSNDDLLDNLKSSFCPSVVKLDDFEVYLDVLELIESEFVGGYPSHASSDPSSPFWDYMREVIDIQVARREDNGNLKAHEFMPLPTIWSGYTLDMVAEAVHDEYPNYHQSNNLARMIGSGSGFSIDNTVIPKRCNAQFLRGPVMIADINTWATRVVGPHNFSAKYAIGRCRPEEIAFSIKTGKIAAQDVPSDVLYSIEAIPNFDQAAAFTAYSEGSPMHPSWPAMHSAASQTSFWMDVVLDLSPEELCQARLTDYGVAYARTVAGVHYADDNIAGLNLGQEIIAALLPTYLGDKYGANEEEVKAKIDQARYDWFTFNPSDPCPFVFVPTPRSLPPISNCQDSCAVNTHPWVAEYGVNQKCMWQETCAGCTECQTSCQPWCYTNPHPWVADYGVKQKCNFIETCAECTECDNDCKSWCYTDTNPWVAEYGVNQKCTWSENCAKCSECDAVCESWCYTNTTPWKAAPGVNQKCQYVESCSGCDECN